MTQTTIHANKTASLADIAKACGVTKATVSRVLNAKPGFSVRQELQDKIHQAAAKLNYRPNGIARSLRSNSTPIVMVLGFHASWLTLTSQPIYGRMLNDFTREVEAMNAACMVDLTTDDDLSPKWASLVPDCALVIPPLNKPRIEKLMRDRIPFVLVNEKGPTEHSCVYMDDYQSACDAVQYLAQLGHKRIAYMNQNHLVHGLTYHTSLPHRMRGYYDTMHQLGLEPVPGFDQYMDQRDYFEQIILKHRPTAVLCYKAESMKYLRDFAHGHGMSVPKDLSLIGFDLITPKYATEFTFTCIDVPMEKMGVEAARMLGLKLNNPNHHEQIRLDAPIVIGQSTAPPTG